jgi:transposase-like protein
VTRLCEQWQNEQKAFCRRDLSAVDYVYVWADGIHVTVRLEEHKLCLLVVIGGACRRQQGARGAG